MEIFEPYNLPFAAALFVLFFLLLLQILGAGEFFGDMDADFDTDIGSDVGAIDGMMSLIGLGKVPFLIWLACFLAIFAGAGVFTQFLALSATGATFPLWMASAIAVGTSLPVTGAIVRPLSMILPEDETTAVGLDSLIRRDAVISIGTAQQGRPARASVRDMYGHTHHVMVEPHDPDAVLTEGELVLLVRRDGDRFFAMQYESPLLQV